eukprot:TRINITY_DN28456_c0_g1_i1.p1 TRINITY_DN28456_c0_g1~~TRINITY_DN28456_c0_g1_i1.p1  ORF type:complete len:103 (-),score=16.19 TRINITY_DN28456_c0_g1_i1:60-368(-)
MNLWQAGISGEALGPASCESGTLGKSDPEPVSVLRVMRHKTVKSLLKVTKTPILKFCCNDPRSCFCPSEKLQDLRRSRHHTDSLGHNTEILLFFISFNSEDA